jgi:quercetin dioxygenase-like cupin family protein
VGRFLHLGTADSFELAPGITARPLFGDGLMLNLVDLEPGASVPPHHHPHEQAGLVLRGELLLTVDGAEHRLGPDDAYQIPGHVEHSAAAGKAGCRAIEIFTPVREDYRSAFQSRPA